MISLINFYLGINMLIAGFSLADIKISIFKQIGTFMLYLLFGIPILIYKLLWRNI